MELHETQTKYTLEELYGLFSVAEEANTKSNPSSKL